VRAAGLSVRQWEVLELIAAGASNQAIAARLHISPHTAARHVASILGKLGAASRGEAAARALGVAASKQVSR
jgi:DNA-binding NarL/FixJ family response regulator